MAEQGEGVEGQGAVAPAATHQIPMEEEAAATPQAENATTTQGEQSVKYKSEERELTVDLWREREQDMERKLSETSDELGRLRKLELQQMQNAQSDSGGTERDKGHIPPSDTQAAQGYDYEAGFLETPAAAARQLQAETLRVVQQELSKEKAARQKEQNTQRFFDDFYAANPDLVQSKGYVNYVFNQKLNELSAQKGDMANVDFRKVIADEARRNLLSFQRQTGGSHDTSTTLEGQGNNLAKSDNDEAATPSSLGGMLRQRRG